MVREGLWRKQRETRGGVEQWEELPEGGEQKVELVERESAGNRERERDKEVMYIDTGREWA